MHPSNEEFLHFDICLDRLQSAWKTLTTIKQHQGHPLVVPSFRFALVEYAAPYTRSDGEHKRYSLDTHYVPPEFMDLHRRLVSSRHQVHAHSDLTVLEASVTFIDLPDQRLVTTVQNYGQEVEELDNIDEIILLLEATLRGMSTDRDRRKQLLEP